MDRRQFLRLACVGSSYLWLSGCEGESRDLAPDVPPREEHMALGPLHSVYTEVRGLRMHALVSRQSAPATASPLVLVHGSGLSGRYMIPTARALTPDFPVYVPDIPGYGDSGDPGKVLNVREMGDWLVAWMEAIGLQRASFLGNSFGCQVIADLAMRHPQAVSRLVLQGPTTPPDERSTFWQFVRWRQNEPYNPGWLGDVTLEAYEKAGLWRMARSYVYQLTDPIEDKMPAIAAPTLVVRGSEDPIAHRAFCERLVNLLPNGRLATIPDVAHTLVFTAPEPLARVTRQFLQREST